MTSSPRRGTTFARGPRCDRPLWARLLYGGFAVAMILAITDISVAAIWARQEPVRLPKELPQRHPRVLRVTVNVPSCAEGWPRP